MAIIPIRPPRTKLQRQVIIDEFGALQAQVDAFKPVKDQHAALREQIELWYEKARPTQPFIEHGVHYTLQVSECANERTIFSMAKLFKLLGLETFLKLCRFPLAAVDAGVEKAHHKEFLTEEHTGPRKIKAVPRSEIAEPEIVRRAA